MTHHLTDNSINQLEVILERLKDNKIPYFISNRNGKIINLDTDDAALIAYCTTNNPELKVIT